MPSVHPSKSSADPTDTILVTDASGNIFNVPASALGGQSTGGYVDPPVYSNSAGEAGQYSWDADFFYICVAEDSWDRFPVSRAGWNTTMPENPTILSLAINEDGDVLTIVFDRVVSMGSAYQNSDINLDASSTGDDIGVSYVSGSGSSTWVFSISEAIRGGEAVNLDYNGRPDGIEDDVGGDLQAISSRDVENGSLSGYSDIILWDGFEGAITGSSYESTNYDYPAFHDASVGSSSISISTAQMRVGSKSLRVNGGSGAFIIDGLSIQARRGRLGFWLRKDAGSASDPIIMLKTSSTYPVIALTALSSTAWNLFVCFIVPNYWRTLNFSVANIENSWRFIEIAWDFDIYGVRILIDGIQAAITSEIVEVQTALFDRVLIGPSQDINSGDMWGYYDNLMLSSDPDRDLYAMALLETCPRTG